MLLYDMEKAPNARRVRMFAAEKGMKLDAVQIDIPGGENIGDAYLAINPRGTVPALKLDDGSVIDESIAICRYLEAMHPEPNLFGQTPLEIGQVASWQRHMEFDGLQYVGWVFRNAQPVFRNRMVPGVVQPMAQQTGLIEAGKPLVELFFDRLDVRLGQSEHVALDRFTVADITAFVTIGFARWVKLSPKDTHGNIQRWMEAVKARPSASA